MKITITFVIKTNYKLVEFFVSNGTNLNRIYRNSSYVLIRCILLNVSAIPIIGLSVFAIVGVSTPMLLSLFSAVYNKKKR